jgi:hypothetical protein
MPPNKVLKVTADQIVTAATGRWGEIAGEINPAEPYVLNTPTKTITVAPLTRRRRKKLKNAQAAYLLAASQLAGVNEEDASGADIVLKIEKLTEDAERAYDSALFGDAVDDIYAYFDDLQEEFWDAFYTDIHSALVNRVELTNGVCPKCGQTVDEDAEGKEASSSTSSTDIGTKSKVTSPPISA